MSLFARCAVVTLALVTSVFAQAQDVSPGVRYKKATAKVNEAFERQLRILNSGKANDKDLAGLFDKVVMCGPNLYGALKRQLPDAARSGKPLTILVPISGQQPQQLEGRVYKTPEDIFDFAVTVEGLCGGHAMKIRRANRREIDYYWSLVPYDIEEPLFVLADDHKAVLFNAGEDGRILYVELLPRGLKE